MTAAVATDVLTSTEEAIAAATHNLATGVQGHLSVVRCLDHLRALKALCELAFIECGRSMGASGLLVDALRPILFELAEEPRFWRLARANLEHANLFLPLLLVLRNLGSLSDGRLRDLATIIRLATEMTTERLPFRQADFDHACFKLTKDTHHYLRIRDAAKFGVLRRGASPGGVPKQDEYAVTHTIFYLTDFGREPWPCLPELATIEEVLAVVEVMANDASTIRDFDILSELILSRAYLQSEIGLSFHEELALLRSAQRADGSFPAPSELRQVIVRDGLPEDSVDFFEHYHTTLVAREALRASLRGGHDGDVGFAGVDLARARPNRVSADDAIAVVEGPLEMNELDRSDLSLQQAFTALGRAEEGHQPAPECFASPALVHHALEWCVCALKLGQAYATRIPGSVLEATSQMATFGLEPGAHPEAFRAALLSRLVVSLVQSVPEQLSPVPYPQDGSTESLYLHCLEVAASGDIDAAHRLRPLVVSRLAILHREFRAAEYAQLFVGAAFALDLDWERVLSDLLGFWSLIDGFGWRSNEYETSQANIIGLKAIVVCTLQMRGRWTAESR